MESKHPNPPHSEGCDTSSIFKQIKTGSNCFLLLDKLPKQT